MHPDIGATQGLRQGPAVVQSALLGSSGLGFSICNVRGVAQMISKDSSLSFLYWF